MIQVSAAQGKCLRVMAVQVSIVADSKASKAQE
jgi:hypothetical protein